MGDLIQFKAPVRTLDRRLSELEDRRYATFDDYILAFDRELKCCGWNERDLLALIDSRWL